MVVYASGLTLFCQSSQIAQLIEVLASRLSFQSFAVSSSPEVVAHATPRVNSMTGTRWSVSYLLRV